MVLIKLRAVQENQQKEQFSRRLVYLTSASGMEQKNEVIKSWASFFFDSFHGSKETSSERFSAVETKMLRNHKDMSDPNCLWRAL